MGGVKSLFSSVTFYGVLTSVGGVVLGFFGLHPAGPDLAQGADLLQGAAAHIDGLVTLAGAAIALWGRIRATKAIG
jgi:hypothetical protein